MGTSSNDLHPLGLGEGATLPAPRATGAADMAALVAEANTLLARLEEHGSAQEQRTRVIPEHDAPSILDRIHALKRVLVDEPEDDKSATGAAG